MQFQPDFPTLRKKWFIYGMIALFFLLGLIKRVFL